MGPDRSRRPLHKPRNAPLASDQSLISASATRSSTSTKAVAARDASGKTLQEQSPESGEVPHSRGPVEAQLLPWMLGPVIAMATVVVPLATVLGGRQPLGFPDPLPASAAAGRIDPG